MGFRKQKRLFNGLLIFTMIFSMLFPLYGSAETTNSVTTTKAKQFSDAAQSEMRLLIAKQKAALRGPAVLHPDLQNVSGDEEIPVVVELKEYPVALVKGINKLAGKITSKTDEKNILQKIASQQQKFKNGVTAKGIKAKFGFTYHYAFNGLSLKLKASEVKQLLNVDGVASIEPDVQMHALGDPVPADAGMASDNTSGAFLNVPAVWDLGYQGQGVKVAVLDTGIDYNHPEFQGVYKGGYNFVDQTNTANYARTRAADDPYETAPLDRPSNKPEFDGDGESFYTEHGTHVAGIIAAQGNNPYGVKGIAPKVDLYAYRVLGAYGTGSNSGIIAAIDKAVEEHMNIMNLSLGGSNNNQVSSDAVAIDNAALAGVTSVIATGNDGPGRGTIGSPGVAAFAISVANSTVPEKVMAAKVNISLDGGTPTAYPMNLMAWKFGQDPGTQLNGTYDLAAVPNYGVDDDYANLDVKGKVALVSRGGDIPFVDKIAAAKKAGAVAVIIHNNGGTNGNGPSGVFLGNSFAYIPAFDMSYTNGIALRTSMATQKATVTFSSFAGGTTAGDDINSSSSRGPANPNFDIKPDISAPGTDIMSSVPAYGKDYPDADYSESYDRMTGTSMAAPHVTGVAALLKQEHPDWTPFDIKTAISNTAKQLDVNKYDVFAQGPGRVQPYQAATAEALAYVQDTTSFSGKIYDNIKGTITFGNVSPDVSNPLTVTRTIKVKNLKDYASNYTVTVEKTKSASGELVGAGVTVDQAGFTLDADGEKELTVTLTVPAGSGSAGNELLGYVHITNGTTNLNLPFAANFSPATGLKNYSIDSKVISPNGDGKLDSTTLRYEFYDKQSYTYIELWDALHQDAGEDGDGYLGYLVLSSSTTTGPKTKEFDGTYYDWGTFSKVNAPDGVYTIDLTTTDQTQTSLVASDWVGPIFVKTTAPKINASGGTTDESDFVLSGTVEDSYIDWKPAVNEVFEEDYDVNSKLAATYQVTNANGETGAATPFTLNQDGSFTIALDGLTVGDNSVKVTVSDDASNISSQEFTVTRESSNPEPDPTPTPGKGKLILQGNPLSNITFSVHTPGDTPVWYDFTTDSEGNFTYNLPDGTYEIEGVWVAPTWYVLNGSFTIKDGLVDGTQNLVIDADHYQAPTDPNKMNVSGILTKDGAPFADIIFSFHTLDGNQWYDARTDAKGEFAVKVPDGTYQIDGIWDGVNNKWYVLNQPFTVDNGKLAGAEVLNVNVSTQVPGNVTGKLTEGGVPLADTIFSIHSGDVWYDAQTDADGNFSFTLPDGTYQLEGIWDAAESKWYALPQEFTVSGSLVYNIDVPAEPTDNVTGVLTRDTEALGDVIFSFHNGDQWYDVKTKADGSFGTLVPDGTYTIEGIWLGAEAIWYVLNRAFTVENGKVTDQGQLSINLPE